MSCVQCEGTTKSGTRCKKNTKDASKRCHNHRLVAPSATTTSVSSSSRTTTRTAPVHRAPTIVIDLTEPSVVISSSVHTYTIQTRSKRRAPVPAAPAARATSHAPAPAPVHREPSLVAAPEDRVKPRPTHRPRPRPKRAEDEHHHEKEGEEDCCICYEKMPVSDALGCSHMVCQSCTKKLRDDRCPMCRAEIKSKYVTSRDKVKINQRRRQDAIDRANESFRSYLSSQQTATIYIPSSLSHRNPIVLGHGIHVYQM